MMIEKNWEWNREIYVGFIDLEKAFDSVPRGKMWETLRDPYYGVNPKLVRVICGPYKVTESAVRTAHGMGDFFEGKAGVRQGGVLSPLLFILYMDKCLREMDMVEGVDVMMYADDVALVAEDREILQRSLERWSKGLSERGLKMNKEKTEVMKIARTRGNLNIEVDGDRIREVEKFKYLRVTVNAKGEMVGEIEERISNYSRQMGMLYLLLRNRHVPTTVKTLIYTTILRPVLLYGSESRTLTTRTKSRIVAAEMRVLRMIAGVTRWERRRHEEIRRETRVEPIEELVERRQLQWFGHVKRMNDDRYPSKLYSWHPQGKRPAGRPRKRCYPKVGW